MTWAPAEAIVQADTDRVRVTRWRLPPGSETGWHTHGHPYVVVPTLGGTLTMVDAADGMTDREMRPGEAYVREAGVSHNVVNRTGAVVEFVETEIK